MTYDELIEKRMELSRQIYELQKEYDDLLIPILDYEDEELRADAKRYGVDLEGSDLVLRTPELVEMFRGALNCEPIWSISRYHNKEACISAYTPYEKGQTQSLVSIAVPLEVLIRMKLAYDLPSKELIVANG
jgi:hypothetical protein